MKPERPHLAKGSNEVFWRIELEVLPGKLEEFRALVKELIDSSEQEPGTLVYDWFFDQANRICHTYEHYCDSDAVIAHATTFGKSFAERFQLCCRQTGLDVYGAPNEAAKALLDQYNARYFAKWQGFESE
jgi:quinol monooxygenase YgiN